MVLQIIGILTLLYVFFEAGRIMWYSYRAIANGKRTNPASNHVSNASASILVVGDSTAYGTGASQQGYSLMGRLIKDFPTVAVTNASQNALTLAELVIKLQSIPDASFDYVMIHIGGIDTISFTPYKKITERISCALTEAKRITRKKVFLISVNNAGAAPMYHFPLTLLFERRSRKVSTILSCEAKKNDVIAVPLFRERQDDPLLVSVPHLFASDGTHPNDEGYAAWYRIIRKGIDPYITHATND